MATPTRKELFARPASGLVREVSTLRATFYDLAGSLCNGFAIVLAYVVLFPTIRIGGFPTVSWAVVIAGVFTVFLILCFAALNTAMPRSGGDYVYTSRIIHPYVGWIEGWTLCWAVVSVMAYNSWAALYNTGIIFLQGIVIAPSYGQLATFVLQPTTLLVLGVFEFILVIVLNLLPPRIYYRIITVLVAISLVCTLLLFIPLIGVNEATFLANFQQYTGMTADQVISTAKNAGWDPSFFNWNAVAASFGYTIFAFFGFNFSSYMAGELKGNIQKNVILSLTVAMVIPVYQITMFLLPFYSVVPYDLINAWGFLFWNAPQLAPLHAAPMTSLISTIANPGMAWFSIIVGYPVLVIFNFIMVVAYVALLTRITFAQTMDRLWPRALSAVGKRTHQPTYLVIFWCAMGYIMFVTTVIGFSPATALWYGVLLTFFALMLPAVNAIVINKRRPDLFELIPTWMQKKTLGLPKLAWFGVIWLVFLIPIYIGVEFWPLLSALIATPITGFFSYIFTTGVLLVVFFLVVGTIWYFTALAIQKRKGIDVEMLFKTIPPE